MNEEQIQALLNHLASIGFKGAHIEQDIRENIDNNIEQFDVQHEIIWEHEKVQFSLQLSKDLQFQAYRLASYRATHVNGDRYLNSQTFTPTPRGICNVNLAFHIVSGRFNDLLEKISDLNLGEFPGVDPYRNLEIFLSRDANEFTLKCSRNEPEGYIEYEIPISRIDGWYTVDTYTATLTPYPDIIHGTYGGVNTKELEDEMRNVNWRNDSELFVLHDDSEPELLSPANDILGKMLKLSRAAEGVLIADILMLKYWSEASLFDSFIEQRAWEYSNALPKREQHFPAELEAKAAFNLLCGRAVSRNGVYPLPHDKPVWVRFDFTTKGPNGGYLTEAMPDFNDEKLFAVLSALPVQEDELRLVATALKRGDITLLELPNEKMIFLEANPERQIVNIYSEDMRLIPFNLHFDPDWKPTQIPELKPEELKRKPRQNIIRPGDPPGKNKRFGRKR